MAFVPPRSDRPGRWHATRRLATLGKAGRECEIGRIAQGSGRGRLMAQTATIEDFERIDIRVGTVVDAQPFPEARKPALKLTIDFGPEIGQKKSSAQITVHYPADRLIGRQVCAVVNFPPRRIGPFLSEVLTLGLPDEDGAVVLIRPDFKLPDGGRLF
jgi:tRNA-binding protein